MDYKRVRPIGSPPRAWGQFPLPDFRLSLRRFTPTRVGTIASTCFSGMVTSVHPHARGDNGKSSFPLCIGVGSPPRAWGQCNTRRYSRLCNRFTPTRVGTISKSPPTHSGAPVHPHARGDNAVKDSKTFRSCGSPPRAWGQFQHRTQIGVSFRFTPTRVGTISNSCGSRSVHAVHPHARGDNVIEGPGAEDRHGSPPRAWGQCNDRRVCLARNRFTPTRVGTMSIHCLIFQLNTVHPHARGDNYLQFI